MSKEDCLDERMSSIGGQRLVWVSGSRSAIIIRVVESLVAQLVLVEMREIDGVNIFHSQVL